MKTRNILMLALTAGLALFAAPITLPAPIACGKVLAFKTTTEPQFVVDFQKAAEANLPDPAEQMPEELLAELKPGTGMAFAIFTVQLEPDKTLSQFDYIIETDNGRPFPCLSMGKDTAGFYDFRLKVQQGPQKLNLLFQCPKNTFEISLKSAYPSIPLPKTGDFIVSERPKPQPKPAPKPQTAKKPETPAKKTAPAAKAPAKKTAPAAKAPAPKKTPAKKAPKK